MFTLQKSFHLHFHKQYTLQAQLIILRVYIRNHLTHLNPHFGSTPIQRHEQIYTLWTDFIFTYLFVCFFENEKDFLSKRQSKKYFTLYCSEYLCFHVSFYYFFPYCHKLLSHPMFRESKRSTGEGQGGHTYKRPCGKPCNLQGFSYFRN